MDLKKIIIHTLVKKKGENAKLTKAKKELAITALHQTFMEDVKNVYYKKSNPIYGVFDAEEETYPYQKFLDNYLEDKSTFLEFTVKAMTHFEKIINEEYNATGGYVLFCHFKTTEEFVAAIMLNDKNGYLVDENLDLKANMRLDIEKLDVANFTNCSKWNNNEDVYLSFTKGKKNISNYFKKFIGCTDFTSAKETSENLKKALGDYLIQAGLEKKAIDEIKENIFSYCQNKMSKKEDISLDHISSLINDEEPNLFKEFASTEQYQVSPTFKGHNTLRSLKYYSTRSKDFTLVFDSKLLGKKIVYNEKKNDILIKDIPEDLKTQLTKQLPAAENNE